MRFFFLNVVPLLVIINVTFACECGIEGATSRVFKGSIARANKYPWLVHLRFWPSTKRSGKFFQCGGVLLDESHVATAAHCVLNDKGKPKEESSIDVYLGRVLALSGHSKPVSVSKIWFDSKFDPVNLGHDFAILTLSKSVTFNKIVGPICLPNNENNLSKLTITGWGKTSNKSTTSDMLMEAQVDYITSKDCYEMKKYHAARINGYPKMFKDVLRVDKTPETLFCAINKRTHADICQGDSGGPIMKKGTNERYYLMGTVSGLMGYCGEETEDVTGVYTRAFYYKDTIKSIAPNACWKD